MDAVVVHEETPSGELAPVGQVRFGFAGKGLWAALDTMRAGPAERGYVPVPPLLVATAC